MKARLRAAESPIERIAIYNDPEAGSLGERVVAAIEYNDQRRNR